jgi:hypothetical protein
LPSANSGWVLTGEAETGKAARSSQVVRKTLQTLRAQGLDHGCIEFTSGKQITEMFEMFDGPMEDEIGYFNPSSVILLEWPDVGLGKSR